MQLDAPTTDHSLVETAADPMASEAWGQLDATYHLPLIRHCLRSGLNAGEAEEVTSQTLAMLSRRLSRTSINWDRVALRAWLAETSNRLIFEVHRTSRQEKFSTNALREIQQCLPPAFVPEDELASREKLEAHLWSVCLARVRADISSKQWQIFESYVLHGNSSPSVAKLFNTTAINVRIIRKRVLVRFKSEWKQLARQSVDLPA